MDIPLLKPIGHTVFRVGAGLLFMEHGLQKLFGMLGGFGGTPGVHAPFMSQMGLAGVLECGGGLLIAVGLFTRPVAALLLGEMVVAFVQAHFPRGGWPIQNQGELALVYASIWVYFATHGPGPFSADANLAKK